MGEQTLVMRVTMEDWDWLPIGGGGPPYILLCPQVCHEPIRVVTPCPAEKKNLPGHFVD